MQPVCFACSRIATRYLRCFYCGLDFLEWAWAPSFKRKLGTRLYRSQFSVRTSVPASAWALMEAPRRALFLASSARLSLRTFQADLKAKRIGKDLDRRFPWHPRPGFLGAPAPVTPVTRITTRHHQSPSSKAMQRSLVALSLFKRFGETTLPTPSPTLKKNCLSLSKGLACFCAWLGSEVEPNHLGLRGF